MAITEQQSKQNQEHYERATADPVECKITGKKLVFDEESQEWKQSDEPISPRFLKIRWGWMGKNYGPDEKGLIREIKGRVEGKLKFGQGIPRPGFIHHQQNLRTQGKNPESNIIVYEVVEVGAGADNDSGSGDAAPELNKMTVAQLIEYGVGKGLDKAELEVMKKADLLETLKGL